MTEAGMNAWMIAVLVPAMLFAGWNDLRTHRVPNWLNAALAAGGLTAHAVASGPSGLGFGAAGLLTGFGLLVALWLLGIMGAGDVKYMAALGAWLGPQMTLYAVVIGGLVGGVMALAMIAVRGRWRESMFGIGILASRCCSLRTALGGFDAGTKWGGASGAMPYAVPLTIGALVAWAGRNSGWWGVL